MAQPRYPGLSTLDPPPPPLAHPNDYAARLHRGGGLLDALGRHASAPHPVAIAALFHLPMGVSPRERKRRRFIRRDGSPPRRNDRARQPPRPGRPRFRAHAPT